MKPYYERDGVTLLRGDCLGVLAGIAAGSVDAVVTDPPAGIKFMGVGWDTFKDRKGSKGRDESVTFDKVGGNSHPRTGFDRAQIQRSEGRRFVEKITPIFLECHRVLKDGGYALVWAIPRTSHWTATALEDAGFEIRDRISHLFGQGFPKSKSCLKPACEDWWLCRKPDRKVAPLSIDECRIPTNGESCRGTGQRDSWREMEGRDDRQPWNGGNRTPDAGRWPANVTLDEEAARLLDEQSGELSPGGSIHKAVSPKTKSAYGDFGGPSKAFTDHGDSGGASRFFYVAKAPKVDRGEGNTHPTVKNTALMTWLVKLITKPGDTVLDCFLGSGSTAVACLHADRKCIGIEREEAYLKIAVERLQADFERLPLFHKPEAPTAEQTTIFDGDAPDA
jgi:DNA modification methylase